MRDDLDRIEPTPPCQDCGSLAGVRECVFEQGKHGLRGLFCTVCDGKWEQHFEDLGKRKAS